MKISNFSKYWGLCGLRLNGAIRAADGLVWEGRLGEESKTAAEGKQRVQDAAVFCMEEVHRGI
jgi:hypothetical protein